MTEQRYSVRDFNRVIKAMETKGRYKITGPNGMDFIHVHREQREKGKRKWTTADRFTVTAENGRVICAYELSSPPLEYIDLDSDQGLAIVAEVAKFYADTTNQE